MKKSEILHLIMEKYLSSEEFNGQPLCGLESEKPKINIQLYGLLKYRNKNNIHKGENIQTTPLFFVCRIQEMGEYTIRNTQYMV